MVLWNAFRSNCMILISRKRTTLKIWTIKSIITLYQVFKILKVHFLQTLCCSVHAVSSHCEKETEVLVTSVLCVTYALIYTVIIRLQILLPFQFRCKLHVCFFILSQIPPFGMLF